jgi:quinol monooxygenase YgiN
MSEHVTVVSRLKAKDTLKAEAKDSLTTLAKATESEAGSIRYVVFQNVADKTEFLLYEIWQDWDAIKEHMETDHFKVFMGGLETTFPELDVLIAKPYNPEVEPLPETGEVIVTSYLKSRDELKAEAKEALVSLATATASEPGSSRYEVFQCLVDESEFILYEIWRDAAAIGEHMETDHFKVFMSKLETTFPELLVMIATPYQPE